jgi:hypothetical protein
VIAILLLLATHALGEANLTTVQCCDLYQSLHQYVAVRGGTVPPGCRPASCAKNHLMRRLVAETRQMRAGDALTVSAALDMTLLSGNLTSSAMADWMLLAFIGRLVTKPPLAEDAPRHDYLEYDAISNQIVVKAAQCQVQETVYEVMLIISIISIIGLMTTQVMVKHVHAQYVQVLAGAEEPQLPMSTGVLTKPAGAGQAVAFAPLRWRLGRPA